MTPFTIPLLSDRNFSYFLHFLSFYCFVMEALRVVMYTMMDIKLKNVVFDHRLGLPIPCSRCALISFCSEKCRDLAWSMHHKFECDILGILRLAGVSITCLMALRVLTQVSLDMPFFCHSRS